MVLKDILLVGAGGFVGSAARYCISLLVRSLTTEQFIPWATLAVNVIGSFMIGCAIPIIGKGCEMWLFLAVGLCGGFTTFSAFSLESFELIRAGQWGVALIYAIVSVVSCLLMTALGVIGAKLITQGA